MFSRPGPPHGSKLCRSRGEGDGQDRSGTVKSNEIRRSKTSAHPPQRADFSRDHVMFPNIYENSICTVYRRSQIKPSVRILVEEYEGERERDSLLKEGRKVIW